MADSKVVFVTGGTGYQGGAVARNLARQGFRVQVLTRHPDSARAKSLAKQQIEIIPGDLNDPGTFREHLKGIAGIFSVQSFENGIAKEIRQGMDLANLARENEVRHFLYSSVSGADQQTGIPHWDSKFIIENHIRQLGLPFTIIRPASFYENFLLPPAKSWLLKGKLVNPVKADIVQQFISTEDIGKISARIFSRPDQYLGKTIMLAAEQMTLRQVCLLFAEILEREVKYQKMPLFITRLAMGKDLYKMFRWINGHDAVFIKDMGQFRKEFPDLISLYQWIRNNFINPGDPGSFV
jgi:uncharacterized protein YbjT (DUF2867 family)